ncbi:MAG: DUF5615 family PIN-like protein [Nitrospirae bacterium]|nr:DUF5615 family PIN-like protein [Nitrospirota bacterium]
MSLPVYLDEDIPGPLCRALTNRGVDVLTTAEAGNLGRTDTFQLAFAAKHGRILVTCNKKDFVLLHKEYLASQKNHNGIVLADQDSIGIMLRRLLKLLSELPASDMYSRLEFLSNWD